METEVTWWQRLLKLNPALITGLIVSVAGLVAAVLGITIEDDTVQNVITLVLGISALLSAVLIKPQVTPNAKVVVRDDSPLDEVATIRPGEATAKPTDMHAVEQAAKAAG